MFEIIGWDIGMSGIAALVLVSGAVVIGVVAQLIGDVRVGWEGIVTGAAALVGGYLASEGLALSTWGPEFEGLYLVPALIGAVAAGALVDALLRFATRGSYASHQARPI